ncbi:MAG: TIGR03663 family protein [Chloroflexi bacterium]|nr:TIGR03663 family protein [Chloroflexota bacterium]
MTEEKRSWLERPIHPSLPAVTNEILLFALIMLAVVVSRFYDLGARVMSHDESLHTYFSWLLYKGQGYQHTPMMHGPLQFHLLSVSYFLFGVSDFTARIPSALFSVASVWMIWYWRRYLGKAGALIAALFTLISPYMLFYGRYVRNETFSGFAGLLMIYAILRYFERGEKRYLYMVTVSLIINFTAKETAFIYAAQALLFLAVYFAARVVNRPWKDASAYTGFIVSLAIAILLVGSALGFGLYSKSAPGAAAVETALPADPFTAQSPASGLSSPVSAAGVLAGLGILALAVAAYFLIRGFGWEKIRGERSFDLLMLIGTMVLPMLTPIVIKAAGWSLPTTAPELAALTSGDIVKVAAALVGVFVAAIAIGLWWNADLWWKNALIFYSVFTILYTTFFTNSSGFFTGLLGSLGYWLVQQGVQRGSQPWYYYLLIQIPIYEFLPALGTLLALYYGLRRRKAAPPAAGTEAEDAEPAAASEDPTEENSPIVFAVLLWWIVSSLAAYSYAGERMPWLTYHITWPMILLSGWALGRLIKRTDWAGLRQRQAPLAMTLIFVFVLSLVNSMLKLAGPSKPFQGKDLESLQATGDFIFPALVALASAAGLTRLLRDRDWRWKDVLGSAALVVFGLLAVLTGRAAYRAAFINYDNATEYLVYAHAAGGVKDVIAQTEEISRRTTGDLSAAIAYDASAPDTGVSWPFVWYLRDYTNLRSFDTPTRALRDSVAIIVDQKNFDKIEPVVGQGYYRSDYIRMWWPNQDYFNLTTKRDPHVIFDDNYPCTGVFSALKLFRSTDFSRLCRAFTDPTMRAGIFNIWLNRDFSLYAQATGSNALTLTTWEPSDRMRFYIRKDVAAQVWNYGVIPEAQTIAADPYEQNAVTLAANLIFGVNGAGPGQFDAPRGIAIAPDGSLYIADSRNHRIQHFSADGEFINAWGVFGDASLSPAPPGAFNEPWGVAVGPDGSVYVSDTWNHRIQKFTADGQPVAMWGHYGLAEDAETFWGPRGIAVDAQGRVYIADTGNKRIVIYSADGQYLTEFGSTGLEPGEFDEPVGVAVDADGVVYVTDTWNQRVQSFADGLSYTPLAQWDIAGWYGQSLDNKPFIAVDNRGHVFVTDPEGYRVLEFTTEGEFVRTWGDFGVESGNFGLAAAVAVDAEGRVWVTDAGNHRVMRFTLSPEE